MMPDPVSLPGATTVAATTAAPTPPLLLWPRPCLTSALLKAWTTGSRLTIQPVHPISHRCAPTLKTPSRPDRLYQIHRAKRIALSIRLV
jgi:hypothetical protein